MYLANFKLNNQSHVLMKTIRICFYRIYNTTHTVPIARWYSQKIDLHYTPINSIERLLSQ